MMKKLICIIMWIACVCQAAVGQSWGEAQQLLASDGGDGERFGRKIAIDGDYAVIGAVNASPEGGAVYVYKNVEGVWVEYQILTHEEGSNSAGFGCDVDIMGDYIVVGARSEPEDSNEESPIIGAGSVHIYKLQDDSWEHYQKIVASDPSNYDAFGETVSIYDQYIIVGVPRQGEDQNGENTIFFAGAAYIFKKEGDFWSQQQKIVANDRGMSDQFGAAVSARQGYFAVGARTEDEDANGENTLLGAGSVYIFGLQDESWIETQKIVSSQRQQFAEFGNDLDFGDDYLVVAASKETSLNGAAYVFELEGDSWVEQQRISASDEGFGDHFGNSVALSGNTLVVGSFYEDDDLDGQNTLNAAGSAYIFSLQGGEWYEDQKVIASDRSIGFEFGSAVAVYGSNVFIGSIGYAEGDESYTGAVYIFNLCAILALDPPPVFSSACAGQTLTLNATSNTGEINWYETFEDSIPIFIGEEFTTPELIAGVTSYSIDLTDGNCATDRVEIEIQVNALPEINVQDNEVEFCEGDLVALSASSNGNQIYWYEDEDSESFVTSGASLIISNITESTSYWVASLDEETGCFSERLEVVVAIGSTPDAPIAESIQTFSGEGMTLAELVVDFVGELTWYADANLTQPISETTELVDGTTYYVTQTINGCESYATAITVDNTLGILEFGDHGITWYPNPTSSILYVESKDLLLKGIKIHGMDGKLFMNRSNDLTSRTPIDLELLDKGFYMVTLLMENGISRFKIVKQ